MNVVGHTSGQGGPRFQTDPHRRFQWLTPSGASWGFLGWPEPVLAPLDERTSALPAGEAVVLAVADSSRYIQFLSFEDSPHGEVWHDRKTEDANPVLRPRLVGAAAGALRPVEDWGEQPPGGCTGRAGGPARHHDRRGAARHLEKSAAGAAASKSIDEGGLPVEQLQVPLEPS